MSKENNNIFFPPYQGLEAKIFQWSLDNGYNFVDSEIKELTEIIMQQESAIYDITMRDLIEHIMHQGNGSKTPEEALGRITRSAIRHINTISERIGDRKALSAEKQEK